MYNKEKARLEGTMVNSMKKILTVILTLIFLLSGCGETGETAAVVGKTKITVPEVRFYLDSVKKQMEGTELSIDEDWETKEIEGTKAIVLARERSIQTAIDNVAYVEVGKKIFGKLSDSEKEQSKKMKGQFQAQFSGADGYKNFLADSGLNESFINMLCDSAVYSSKLLEKVTKEDVTEDTCKSYFEENKDSLEETYLRAKHVLILTKDMNTRQDLPAEEQAAAKVKAEEILKQAQSGADFDALVSEYSEDPGSKTNPDGYVFKEGDMVQEFWDCTNSLGIDEIGFVKSEFGYHIIKRLALTPEVMTTQLTDLAAGEVLAQKMQDWILEYDITVEKNSDILDTIF